MSEICLQSEKPSRAYFCLMLLGQFCSERLGETLLVIAIS